MQFRRGEGGAAEGAQLRHTAGSRPGPAVQGPAGITIGGPGNVRSRFARRNLPGHDAHMSAALQVSMDSAREEAAQRGLAAANESVPANGARNEEAEDGEGGNDGPAGPAAAPSRWAAAAVGGSSVGGAPRPEDFPALPGALLRPVEQEVPEKRDDLHWPHAALLGAVSLLIRHQ